MEQSKRKIKYSSIILTVLLILVISATSYYTYNNYSKLDKNNFNEKELKEKLNNLKKDEDLLNKESKDINNSIEELNSLDSKIINIKEEVFSLASKVEEKIQNNETDKKIAYITFDDGPYYLTDSVIKLLKEKKVKATFFTIGAGKQTCYDNRSADCTEMYKKIVDNNHTIANHTYSHAIFYGLYASVNSFMEQVEKQEQLIKEKTGVITNIIRFPGGSRTAGSLKNGIIQKLREKGYGWVDWTAQDGDGGDLDTKAQAWSNFKGSINSNIEVILFHDYDRITYSILSEAIDYLENNNYILLPLFHDSVMVNK